jgi:hypothetical protein
MQPRVYHEIEGPDNDEGGLSPDGGWPDWCDEYRYVPPIEDAAEAAALFALRPATCFETWIDGLDDGAFVEVARALGVLRRAIARYNTERTDRRPRVAVRDILEAL